jgi:hypothetical protein
MFFSAQFSNWKNYVKQDWVMGRWQTLFTPDQSRGDKVVPWLCVAFERWYKYVEAYS